MTQEEIKLMKPGDKFLFNGMHAEVTSNRCGILAYELLDRSEFRDWLARHYAGHKLLDATLSDDNFLDWLSKSHIHINNLGQNTIEFLSKKEVGNEENHN